MKAKLLKVAGDYHLYDGDKAIATSVIGDNILLPNLSWKNCQAIENGYDLYELAKEETIENEFNSEKSFIKGFQKALEILAENKFSVEDMIHAIAMGVNHSKFKMTSVDIIKSLQKTEWDVNIEMENKGAMGENDNKSEKKCIMG